MSGLRSLVKDGWHPKGNDGGRESWRGDFKGINQVAGWVGKGKCSSSNDSRVEHVSRPLSSLKDPASFPPPPKHINRLGVERTLSSTSTSNTGLLRPPLSSSQSQSPQEQLHAEEEANSKRAPPPVPYRANTTGVSTHNVLSPPIHQSHTSTGSTDVSKSNPSLTPKPALPPRLPPRGAPHPHPHPQPSQSSPPPPPPAHETTTNGLVPTINQRSINFLGEAEISVPSLGINGGNSDRQEPAPKSTGGASPYSPQNELQARFAKISASSPTLCSSGASKPAEGTTMEQKQHAVRTAHSFSRDPTSVSTNDARSAVSTALNFRERHSEQIDSGKKKLLQIDQKYGISKRINSFIEDQKSPACPDSQPPPHANALYSPQPSGAYAYNRPDLEALNSRKPPPPPTPSQKPGMQVHPVDGHPRAAPPPPPPPLPLGTKPR
ncbi:hypothetical protein PABG_06117 [Paracoccidioides brasiliensis Pb03]|nr:hypothetical protein PABG_06117 [Paracoccidioides brasiliensis Pb03]